MLIVSDFHQIYWSHYRPPRCSGSSRIRCSVRDCFALSATDLLEQYFGLPMISTSPINEKIQ